MIPINEVVVFDVVTHVASTGAVSDADSAPTFDVFEEDTDTPILSAQTMTNRTSKTGNYRGTFTCSTVNGFEAGKWYSVVVSATVSSVSAKCVAKHFRIAPAESTAGVPVTDPQAATVRSAVGLASANLDTQLDALPTNAELATALGTADDAVLAAIAALNNLSSAGAQSAAAAALAAYGAALETTAQAVKMKTDNLTFTSGTFVDANIQAVNDVTITGTGVETSDEWRPA